jgi:hypothetical protein
MLIQRFIVCDATDFLPLRLGRRGSADLTIAPTAQTIILLFVFAAAHLGQADAQPLQALTRSKKTQSLILHLLRSLLLKFTNYLVNLGHCPLRNLKSLASRLCVSFYLLSGKARQIVLSGRPAQLLNRTYNFLGLVLAFWRCTGVARRGPSIVPSLISFWGWVNLLISVSVHIIWQPVICTQFL